MGWLNPALKLTGIKFEKGEAGMVNVIIAVLATVLGFATSAVVAEVRGHGPAAAPVVAAEIPAQFRPILSAEAPAFVSTKAPGWNERTQPVEMVAARSFVVTRSVGVER
jgi:hypothetical protein